MRIMPYRTRVPREMNNALMFSSKSDEWATPQEFFDQLHAEFAFAFDAAASTENHKRPAWFGPSHPDRNRRDWLDPFSVTEIDELHAWGWCNPPYSRGLQARFIGTCARRRRMVMLLPARTDTKAFHAHIYDASKWQAREGVEIRFLPGRLKFGGCKDAAPFPSMIIVFRP